MEHFYEFQDMFTRIERTLHRVEGKLDKLIGEGQIIMSALDDLTAQVAQNTTIEGSAVTLIQGIAAQLSAAGSDPAKLSALQTQLKNSADALAAAIAANTPAAAPAAPTPAPTPTSTPAPTS